MAITERPLTFVFGIMCRGFGIVLGFQAMGFSPKICLLTCIMVSKYFCYVRFICRLPQILKPSNYVSQCDKPSHYMLYMQIPSRSSLGAYLHQSLRVSQQYPDSRVGAITATPTLMSSLSSSLCLLWRDMLSRLRH